DRADQPARRTARARVEARLRVGAGFVPDRQDRIRRRVRRAAELSNAERRLLRIPAAAAHRRGGDRCSAARGDGEKWSGAHGRCPMKRFLDLLMLALRAVSCAKKKEADGVTQDDSGRRVVAWIDPMYSQGPPHLYKSKHPGIAPDCGMKLIPQYAEGAATGALF